MSAWKNEDNRIYHGIEGEDGTARIMSAEYRPTGREIAAGKGRLLLGELHTFGEEHGGQFGWGHNGDGTSRAASAVLADALNEPQQRHDPNNAVDELTIRFREEFCEDVLSQFWCQTIYSGSCYNPVMRRVSTTPASASRDNGT